WAGVHRRPVRIDSPLVGATDRQVQRLDGVTLAVLRVGHGNLASGGLRCFDDRVAERRMRPDLDEVSNAHRDGTFDRRREADRLANVTRQALAVEHRLLDTCLSRDERYLAT